MMRGRKEKKGGSGRGVTGEKGKREGARVERETGKGREGIETRLRRGKGE